MEPTEIKKDPVIEKCPYCRSERFTVDWSVRDVRSEPIALRERYVCDDCGKRFAQEWKSDGWRMTHSSTGELKSGRNYLERCIACGSEDMEVRHGGVCQGMFEEAYRCEKCGTEHVQIWKGVGWSEIDKEPEFNVNVLDHDRPTIEKDEDEVKYSIDKPPITSVDDKSIAERAAGL